MLKDYSVYQQLNLLPDFTSSEWGFIYYLLDPITKEIRYVGKAVNINRRKCEHLAPSRLKEKCHRNSWIKSLLEQDLKPIMVIKIATKNITELGQLEKDEIKNLRSKNVNLTNHTEGGEGVVGYKWGHHTEESKRKISLANKGKPRPNRKKETYLKICKPVIGTNVKTGEIIEFSSLTDASAFVKVSIQRISQVCKGNKTAKTAGGFKWKYKE